MAVAPAPGTGTSTFGMTASECCVATDTCWGPSGTPGCIRCPPNTHSQPSSAISPSLDGGAGNGASTLAAVSSHIGAKVFADADHETRTSATLAQTHSHACLANLPQLRFRPVVINVATAVYRTEPREQLASWVYSQKAVNEFFAYLILPCEDRPMSALEAADNPAQPNEISRKSLPPPKPEPGRTTQKPGTQLGRWTLLKPLARGGMGEVYVATAGGIEGAERPAVVKIIRREHRKDSSFLARFFDEARIQAQLQHPGVAQVLEASTDSSGNPYVVLEHIEGRNLSEVRQRTSQLKMPMSWADAVAIAVSLAEALVHVHERTDAAGRALSIVHRDMSPQNVMVGYAGDVKLIDFGTARGENRRCQTVSGVVFAKPGYVAPEVANQNQPGAPADLYALGIILWELCMGRRFLTGDPSEHLSKVASGERQPQAVSSSLNVPLELDTIIARLTAPRLEDRYHSAREALTDLVRVLSRAPSLADGERSVRGRIAHLMNRLYPSEPMRTRSEFARLLSERRQEEQPNPFLPESPQPADTADLLPGTRYKVVGDISRSPMSVVYEAVHVDLERKVALKVLPKERCEDPRFEARFRREARALAQLRDPSMVTLHDFGVSQDGRPFYAMELLEGQTLKQHVATHNVSWTEALRFGIGVCQALEVAHEHGIVHRDVKPENVFLTSKGQIKLIDFGVAHDGEDDNDEEHSNALSINGTPAYMAPEQIGRGNVTPSADIYALGTVLYELITGQLPFTAQTAIGLVEAKRKGAVAPRRLRAGAPWPSALDNVLLKALEPSPPSRYPSARRFREALQNLERRSRSGSLRKLTATAFTVTAAGSLVLGWLSGNPMPAPSSNDAQLAALAAAPGALNPTSVETAADENDVESDAVAAAVAAPGDPDTGELGARTEAARQDDADPAPADQPATIADPTLEPPAEPSAESDEASVDRVEDEPSATEATPKELSEDELNNLERAERLLRGDTKSAIRALDLLRTLGANHESDARILQGWSRAAARCKWWGESLQVALKWAAVDHSPIAQLHLARTQRLVGQRYGAIQTLERFLEGEPSHKEALAMLERYRDR